MADEPGDDGLVLGLGAPAAAATGVSIYRWARATTGLRRALVLAVGAGVGLAISLTAVFASEFPPLALAVARWKACDYQLEVVPSLTGLEHRLRRDWLIEFLQRPHDLRPDLPATMPRLRVSPEEARAIAHQPVTPLPGMARKPLCRGERVLARALERGREPE